MIETTEKWPEVENVVYETHEMLMKIKPMLEIAYLPSGEY
jgi:hypothetical protein